MAWQIGDHEVAGVPAHHPPARITVFSIIED